MDVAASAPARLSLEPRRLRGHSPGPLAGHYEYGDGGALAAVQEPEVTPLARRRAAVAAGLSARTLKGGISAWWEASAAAT